MKRLASEKIRPSRVVHVAILAILIPLWSGQILLAQDASEKDPIENAEVEPDLEEFAGTYGPRKIIFRNGGLLYSRDGMPTPVTIKALGEDSFKVIVPAGAQVRGPGANGEIPTFKFNRGDSGSIESLSLVSTDGSILATSKRDN